MTLSRANAGNFRMDTESSLGTAAGSAVYLRPEEVPEMPTQTRQMVANSNAGHRHPYERSAKPQQVEITRENAIKFGYRIRRATTDGGVPGLATMFKSAGWKCESMSSATTTTGTPTTTAIDLSADVTDEGQACLIEETAGVYKPVLVANYDATPTVTPSIALAAAPAASEVVEVMHTLTTASSTTYQVPSNQTLQFQWNSWAQYDDALGDLSVLCTGCALSSVDAIEIGAVGSFPVINMTYHCGSVDITADDIAAETFADSAPFAMITDDFEFAFAPANMSGIGTLVSKGIEKVTINPNINVVPVPVIGTGSVNGTGGYMLIPGSPTITFSGYFTGDSALENAIITELEDDNTSQYIHCVQPTRDLDTPAFGFWFPNCHIASDDSFNIQMAGDNAIKFEATFEASTSGYDSLTNIDEVETSPMYFAISGEAA